MNEEQMQAELNRIQSFYNAVIDDLTRQIGRLSYEKAAQSAVNQENEKTIQSLTKSIEESKKEGQ